VADPAAVLVAARDEEGTIAATVAALREQFPGAELIVADDGSRDATAAKAERAGATVLKLPRRGKGQALTFAELAAPPGSIVLADADLVGDLRPLADGNADLQIAAFAERRGGGFGIAKRAARELIRLRSGFSAREPLSGQRRLSEKARDVCFPVANGFGCEVRMTIDAARAGLAVTEVELPLDHSATGRFCHGDSPSMADCCLIPQLFNARRFDCDLSPYPRLVDIEKNCLALPAFSAALPERQPDSE